MDALLLFSLLRVNGLVMEKITNLSVEYGIAKRAQSHLSIVKHHS
jgi:hypothetical protein